MGKNRKLRCSPCARPQAPPGMNSLIYAYIYVYIYSLYRRHIVCSDILYNDILKKDVSQIIMTLCLLTLSTDF